MRDYTTEKKLILESFRSARFNNASYEFMQSTLDGMDNTMSSFHSMVEAATKSGEFSKEGLRKLKIREANKALADLNTKAEIMRTLDNRMFALRASLKPKNQSPEDKLVTYLRQREIRDYLRGLDPLELKVVYQQATEHEGFAEVADAIESAPAIPGKAPLLSKEDLAQGREMRLLRDNPMDAHTLNELKTVKSMLDSFYRPCIKELEETLGVLDDPIAKMAGADNGSGSDNPNNKA